MNAKLPNTQADWVDPDDAPELTGDELEHPLGVWMDGDKAISPEEGKAYFREMLGKKQVSMLLDVAVIEYFKAKASGHGYQTLINETLRQAIERETLEETLRRVLREELAQHSKEG
jgi:uncharacterized protein (DUF4415 family)